MLIYKRQKCLKITEKQSQGQKLLKSKQTKIAPFPNASVLETHQGNL